MSRRQRRKFRASFDEFDWTCCDLNVGGNPPMVMDFCFLAALGQSQTAGVKKDLFVEIVRSGAILGILFFFTGLCTVCTIDNVTLTWGVLRIAGNCSWRCTYRTISKQAGCDMQPCRVCGFALALDITSGCFRRSLASSHFWAITDFKDAKC